MGVLGTAAPFCLLAYATLSLEAGFTSLLNATTPMFTAVVGAVWLGTAFRWGPDCGAGDCISWSGDSVLGSADFSD